MCIREVHSFVCVGLNNQPVTHVQKYNNLCAARTPCARHLWERRVTHFPTMCPRCTGQSEVVPGLGTAWSNVNWRSAEEPTPRGPLSEAESEAWADAYVDDWAAIMDVVMFMATTPVGRMRPGEQARVLVETGAENLCNEHSHQGRSCRCDARRDVGAAFLYNPAMAVRKATMFDFMVSWKSAREVRQDVQDAADKLLRELIRDRREKYPFFREGRARQPLLSADEVLYRQGLVLKTVKQAFDAQGRVLGERFGGRGWAMQRAMDRMFRRYLIVKALGLMMMEDVGISTMRLHLVLRRICRVAHEQEDRNWDKATPVTRLAWSISEHGDAAVTLQLIDAMEGNTAWLGQQKKKWWLKYELYRQYRDLFFQVTEAVEGDEWEELRAQGQTNCAICAHNFFETPDESDKLETVVPRTEDQDEAMVTSVHASSRVPSSGGYNPWDHVEEGRLEPWHFFMGLNEHETSEVPVRITGCGHIFGGRCLFVHWSALEAGQKWSCPACRFVSYEPRAGEFGFVSQRPMSV